MTFNNYYQFVNLTIEGLGETWDGRPSGARCGPSRADGPAETPQDRLPRSSGASPGLSATPTRGNCVNAYPVVASGASPAAVAVTFMSIVRPLALWLARDRAGLRHSVAGTGGRLVRQHLATVRAGVRRARRRRGLRHHAGAQARRLGADVARRCSTPRSDCSPCWCVSIGVNIWQYVTNSNARQARLEATLTRPMPQPAAARASIRR